MYKPARVPLDVSQVASYLERELNSLAGAVNGLATKRIIPIWTGSGSNPVLGNGSLDLEFWRGNNVCEVWLQLSMGSTTTVGSGDWSFELPVAPRRESFGFATLRDVSANRYAGACRADPATGQLTLFTHATSGLVGAAAPFAWANGDQAYAHIRYLC